MLKITKIAMKELKLIQSEKKNLIIILTYPLVVIFALALAFGGSGFFGDLLGESGLDRADMLIYLPQKSIYFDSADFLEKFGSHEKVRLHKANSPGALKQGIRLNVSRVGLIVNEPRQENEVIEVDLLYDNSALLASRTMATYVRFAINTYAYKKSSEILDTIWRDLSKIKTKLVLESGKAADFKQQLADAKDNLISLKTRVNRIDISSIENSLDTFKLYYRESLDEIDVTLLDAEETKSNLNSYRNKLISTRADLISYRSIVTQAKNEITNLINIAPPLLTGDLQDIWRDLTDAETKMNTAISDIGQALNDINSAETKVSQLQSKLNSTRQRLNQANAKVDDFSVTLASIKETIREVNSMVDDALQLQIQTNQDLDNTIQLLDDLVGTLTEFQSYRPNYLVNPVNITEKKMYAVDELAVISPIGIAIVLMLTTMLLTSVSVIREKEQGATLRSKLSPTSKFTLFFGKSLGQLVFSLFEASIIIVIATLVFGVPLPASFLDLAIVLLLVSFCFVSIGLFLTNFAQTQSTAVLSGLLLIVPMIFLSGIVFPIEFMPSLVSFVSQNLPLYLAINLLQGVLIKGTSLFLMLPDVLLTIGYSVFFFATVLLNKKV